MLLSLEIEIKINSNSVVEIDIYDLIILTNNYNMYNIGFLLQRTPIHPGKTVNACNYLVATEILIISSVNIFFYFVYDI